MCVYIILDMCTCICTYVYVHMYMFICIDICMFMFICKCLYIYIQYVICMDAYICELSHVTTLNFCNQPDIPILNQSWSPAEAVVLTGLPKASKGGQVPGTGSGMA